MGAGLGPGLSVEPVPMPHPRPTLSCSARGTPAHGVSGSTAHARLRGTLSAVLPCQSEQPFSGDFSFWYSALLTEDLSELFSEISEDMSKNPIP